MDDVDGFEDGNLEDFMETVMTYKCKFCMFTATNTQDMAHHVRSLHIKKQPTSTSTNAGQKLVSLISSAGGTTLQRVTPPAPSMNPISLVPSMSGPYSTELSEIHGTQTPLHVTLPRTDPTKVVNSTATKQKLNEFAFISQGEDGQIILQNSENVEIGSNGMVHVLVRDPGEEETVDNNQSEGPMAEAGTVPRYLIKNTSIEADTETSFYVEEKQDTMADAEESTEIVKFDDTVDDPGVEDVLTKELYLCGTCSEGFATIQLCKTHMIEQHDAVEFQSAVPSVVPVSGKVDATTQVEPKKRGGRKKKSDTSQQGKAGLNKDINDESDQEDEIDIPMSESDEDWVENLHAYSSTRSRRKRRPPQALRKDYYLGRKKKNEPKKKDVTEWGLRCKVKGCGTKFLTEELLKKHMEFHTENPGPRVPMFQCTACPETFQFWKPVKVHMWKEHSIDVGMFRCAVCEFIADSHSKLKIHMETHGSDRPYKCSNCDKGFKQFAQLKNHEYVHMGKEAKTLSEYAKKWHAPKDCMVCGRTFANMKCMKKHMSAVHSGEKKFRCTYCDHACSRKAMLILHLRTHTGEKPFKCNQCRYTCSDHNALRRHNMRHTGQKPYKCPHCPYACIQAISLKVHVKNKHPGLGGIFCCSMCLYRTVNELQYNNHLLDHENGLIFTEHAIRVADPNGQLVVKNVLHRPRKPRAQVPKQVILTDLAGQSNILQVLQPQTAVQQQQQQIVQLPVSTGNGQEHVAHLQIQLNENGENVISAEEYEKLTNCENNSQTDVAMANLIYSALSAISLQSIDQSGDNVDPQDLLAQVENGTIQTAIETNSNKEGVTTHTITFHLPNGGALVGGVTLQEGNEEKDAVTVLQVANGNENDWQIADNDINENGALVKETAS